MPVELPLFILLFFFFFILRVEIFFVSPISFFFLQVNVIAFYIISKKEEKVWEGSVTTENTNQNSYSTILLSWVFFRKQALLSIDFLKA